MKTSVRMGRVRHFDTPIEVTLRRAVWAQGVRFRTHLKGIPGRPDFGLKTRKVAVFVDGCFWHGCPKCKNLPTTHQEFWREKVAYNQARRRHVRLALEKAGWQIVEVWGHEIERDIERVADRVCKALRSPRLPQPDGRSNRRCQPATVDRRL